MSSTERETATTDSSLVSTAESPTPTSIAMCPDIPSTTARAAAPDCPTNNGQIYTTGDGSQWMLACDEDYGGSDIGGMSAFAETMSQCIDLCSQRGIECMGLTFVPDSAACWLKFKMMPSGNPGVVLHSAVRIGRLGPASPSTQLLLNGDFLSDLSPWSITRGPDLLSDFIWSNGAA